MVDFPWFPCAFPIWRPSAQATSPRFAKCPAAGVEKNHVQTFRANGAPCTSRRSVLPSGLGLSPHAWPGSRATPRDLTRSIDLAFSGRGACHLLVVCRFLPAWARLSAHFCPCRLSCQRHLAHLSSSPGPLASPQEPPVRATGFRPLSLTSAALCLVRHTGSRPLTCLGLDGGRPCSANTSAKHFTDT